MQIWPAFSEENTKTKLQLDSVYSLENNELVGKTCKDTYGIWSNISRDKGLKDLQKFYSTCFIK